MTTKTRAIEIHRGGTARVGKFGMTVTLCAVVCEQFSWAFYVNAKDEWWEGCGNCEDDSGHKPWYAGIHGGVCFQCGGVGVRRVAGSEGGLKQVIRRRVSSRLSKLNAAEKAEEKRLADAEAYSMANRNLASDLARIRVNDELGGNVLARFALTLLRQPLSVKQEAYAISLLAERAWDEAHANAEAPVAHYVGNVGERISVAGSVSVAHYCPTERYDRTATMLIVVKSVEGYVVKMNTAAAWAFNVSVGDSVVVSGVVKEHADNQYGKQTVLSRPKKEK
jgi:hypothetical protein